MPGMAKLHLDPPRAEVANVESLLRLVQTEGREAVVLHTGELYRFERSRWVRSGWI